MLIRITKQESIAFAEHWLNGTLHRGPWPQCIASDQSGRLYREQARSHKERKAVGVGLLAMVSML